LDQTVRELLRDRKYLEAEQLLGSLETDPAPAPSRLALLGEVRFHLDRPDEAQAMCHHALHLQPGLADAHYVLSLIQYASGQYNNALVQAQFANKCAPNESRILAQLGLCCIAVQDYGLARDSLQQAVLRDPTNVPALNNLGIAHHAMDSPGEALYCIQRALAIEPDYQPAQDNLKSMFGIDSYTNQYDKESNAFLSQIEMSGKPDIHYSPETEAKLTDKLESEFEEWPDDPETVIQLVRHYLKTLKLESATDVLNIGLANNPENASLLIESGLIAHQFRNLDQAKNRFEKALTLEPDNIDALIGLGKTLRHQDKLEEALAQFEKAANVDVNDNTQIGRASCRERVS
jgi:tetratricopeptide (TPR) repeat protein